VLPIVYIGEAGRRGSSGEMVDMGETICRIIFERVFSLNVA